MSKPTGAAEASMEATLFPFHHDVSTAIDSWLTQLPEGTEATEGFQTSLVAKIFIGVIDTFIGLLNTFRTNAFKCASKLKRSELREFVESNRLKTSVVFGLNYDSIKDREIDVPSRMIGDYTSVIGLINAVYNRSNALPLAKQFRSSAAEALVLMSAGDEAKFIAAEIETLANTIAKSFNAVKQAAIECQKSFSGPNAMTRPFETLFKSKTSLQNDVKSLLDMEYRLKEVAPLVKTIEEIEPVLHSILKVVDSIDVPPAKLMCKAFGDAAKNIALVFDAYGMAATRQMAVEHNIILGMNRMYANTK